MSEEEIDLKELFSLFLKKKVFIVVVTLVFIIFGILFSFFVKPQKYTAHSYITFGRIEGYIPQEGESQLLSEIQFNSTILGNYKNFMLSNDVLNAVIENLKLEDVKLGDLKEQIELETSSATIEIIATANSEELSENIANELLHVFIEKSKDFYRIEHTYTISDADESTTESNVNHVLDLICFTFVGLIISMGAILVKFVFNPAITSEKTIEEKMKLPYITSIKNKTNKNKEILENSDSLEQFDVLRANIEFSDKNEENKKTLFITSVNKSEGKSYISVNLAQAFSRIGKKVLVIDTDKKDGALNKIFEVENTYGLSNYLVDSNKISERDKKTENKFIQSTKIENLDVITIGTTKGKKLNIIQNDKLVKFLEEMKENYDVIILDGAEMLEYADSRFLTNIADGTILVVEKNKTSENDLLKATKEINKVKGSLLGIVVNEIEK